MIYLDHAATTPLDPRVFEVMLPYLKDTWGNPSSPHAKGREARVAIDDARGVIASLLGVKPHEVIFVSSGSEANSLAIFGCCEEWMQTKKRPGKLILLSTEHTCSLEAAAKLQSNGWQVVFLPVDSDGLLLFDSFKQAITDDTALVSIQWANNEVGTIQPIEDVARICNEHKVPFHCDAVQAMGQLPLPALLPDLMTIAAHKFYGPKGIGALIIREGVKVQPQMLGGDQEFRLRAGTENTPGIVGMAEALKLALQEQQSETQRLTELRDFFIAEVLKVPGISLNGHPQRRLPNNVNIHCTGKNAETLVVQLDLKGVCASTGSACVTGSSEPSHVLQAMGRSEKEAGENVRFSLGTGTTKKELIQTLTILKDLLQ